MELNDNFWKWFGNSKVVDNQGKPLVVYHGTNKSFNSFDKLKRGSVTGAKSSMNGFWFTTDKNIAGSYANLADYKSELSTLKRELKRLRNFPLANFKKEDEIEERIKELEKINTDNKHIISVYLKIENPKIIDAKGQIYNDFEENINQALYNMNGYDGLIVKNLIDVGEDENPSDFKPSTHYMVLSSNQIKSINNKGTWSNSDNIYESFNEDYKGYRYILTFDGEPQGIGMFQGLSEIYQDEEYIESLEDLFKELEIPEEVFIKNHFTTSYFTEKGLEKFKSAIDTLQQAYREYSGFDIELITEDIPEDKIVYQDEYQIIIKDIKEGENIFETLNREIERYL